MAKNVSELIKKVFIDYCQNKGYQWKSEEDKEYIRLNVARLTEKSIVNIYNTGTIQIQGKRNSLRKELKDLNDITELTLTHTYLDADPEEGFDDFDLEFTCFNRYEIKLG